MRRTFNLKTLRRAHHERIKENPFVVRLSNHELWTLFMRYKPLDSLTRDPIGGRSPSARLPIMPLA
jgi:hypothetical protein